MNSNKTVFISTLLMLFSINLFAQRSDDRKHNFFNNVVSGNSKLELFNDISFGGFDLVSANLNYSEESSLQKITFSPFKLMEESTFLNDSKFNFTQTVTWVQKVIDVSRWNL